MIEYQEVNVADVISDVDKRSIEQIAKDLHLGNVTYQDDEIRIGSFSIFVMRKIVQAPIGTRCIEQMMFQVHGDVTIPATYDEPPELDYCAIDRAQYNVYDAIKVIAMAKYEDHVKHVLEAAYAAKQIIEQQEHKHENV